jgi:hypothetical protein
VHDDHFAQNTPDEIWLTEIGKRGWVLLTKDPRIRTNELERRALLDNNVAAFMLGRGEVSGARMVDVFIKALDGMHRPLRCFDVGLIASVALDGGVTVRVYDLVNAVTAAAHELEGIAGGILTEQMRRAA